MTSDIIKVARHKGELFFRAQGILMDMLHAEDIGVAEIEIIRSGKKINEGEILICGRTPGLEFSFETPVNLEDRGVLLPEYFQEGDDLKFYFDENIDVPDFKKIYVNLAIFELLGGIKKVHEILNLGLQNREIIKKKLREREARRARLRENFIMPNDPILRRINKKPRLDS